MVLFQETNPFWKKYVVKTRGLDPSAARTPASSNLSISRIVFLTYPEALDRWRMRHKAGYGVWLLSILIGVVKSGSGWLRTWAYKCSMYPWTYIIVCVGEMWYLRPSDWCSEAPHIKPNSSLVARPPTVEGQIVESPLQSAIPS
ncbi:hypothetical protein BGX38DRAFT_1138883 [Terfezia claveryi]|nr:hypothetical protein BGX38DRAFT_1138883 [Terfezia claveryi]